MDEFPGNSRRPPRTQIVGQENLAAEPEEQPKLEPVVTGKVLRRKKTLGRRLKDTFFAGDGVVSHIAKDVLIPALQDLLTDMVKQGIERAVYGEVRTTRPSTYRGSATRTHVSYDRVGTTTRPAATRPPVGQPAVQPDSFDVREWILEDRIQVDRVIDQLNQTLDKYDAVTVANLKELLNETSVYTDHKWGWEDLSQMAVRRIREGYLLQMPEIVDLR